MLFNTELDILKCGLIVRTGTTLQKFTKYTASHCLAAM